MKDTNAPKIYESPDRGKTVYARDFGSDIRTRVLIKSDGKQQNTLQGSGREPRSNV